jgi:hypothetical protein
MDNLKAFNKAILRIFVFCHLLCKETHKSRHQTTTANGGVERSRCAEPNQASIDCITRIESARLKKDVMEHHNDKEISMKHVQIKPHNQFETALQPRASIKKSKFL